jgi:anti-sigma regulatory factor (Ser/Thr protein kinase)
VNHSALQTFPRSARAPGDARRCVADLLSAWQIADRCSAILLALSELVTNAVTHGRGLVTVRVALRHSILRVEVEDEGSGLPSTPVPAAGPGPDALGGHGLHIVEQVADDWGHCRRDDDESIVWFETRCPG